MGQYYTVVCHECRQRLVTNHGGLKLREMLLSIKAAAEVGQFVLLHQGHKGIGVIGDWVPDYNRVMSEYDEARLLDDGDVRAAWEAERPKESTRDAVISTLRKAAVEATRANRLLSKALERIGAKESEDGT